MADGSLSQEEIDMLLQGADSVSSSPIESAPIGGGGGGGVEMSPLEQDSVADIINQAMESGTQGLEFLLSRTVKLGRATPESRSKADIEREFSSNTVIFVQQVSGALNGTMAVAMPLQDAIQICSILLGAPEEVQTSLDSAQIDTLKEAFNLLLSSLATQISIKVGSGITPMPMDVISMSSGEPFPLQEGPSYLKIQIPLDVEGAVDTRLSVLLPMAMAAQLYQLARGQAQPEGQVPIQADMSMGPQPGQADVRSVDFPQISLTGAGPTDPNINLLMDVQMVLTVELGTSTMFIKEILGLGEGSIIELNKLAGEPVDLKVSGKLIAKGEVVVIDENFGVRITDIVSSPGDRRAPAKE